jgi:hypothetical protein
MLLSQVNNSFPIDKVRFLQTLIKHYNGKELRRKECGQMA